MDDCIFCKIIKGEIPSAKVYEDSDVVAFLTIEAINPGHTLVIPKIHQPNFQDLEDSNYHKMMAVVKKVAKAIDEAYKPKKVGMLVQGYEVAHAHVHVLPTYEPGDVSSKKLLENAALHPSSDELVKEAALIKQNL